MSAVAPQPDTAAVPARQERRKQPLSNAVRIALDRYLAELDGDTPANLYDLVLAEVERPLLETIMNHLRGNQSKAAQALGINRSTLRKKLLQYGIDGIE